MERKGISTVFMMHEAWYTSQGHSCVGHFAKTRIQHDSESMLVSFPNLKRSNE